MKTCWMILMLLAACAGAPPDGVDEQESALCYNPSGLCAPCFHFGAGNCCYPSCPSHPNMATSCGANEECVYTCVAGFYDCNHSLTDGCEATLNTTTNCGACGNSCPTPTNGAAACLDGACYFSCSATHAPVCQ